METAAEDGICAAMIYNAWWSNEVDSDGDGYKGSARLNWDRTCELQRSLTVCEKVYWKLSSSGTWTLLTTTSAHMNHGGDQRLDRSTWRREGGSHGVYDWKIEIYRAGSRRGLHTDPSNDSDLNDYAMETAAEDGICAAMIYNAWWSNEVDSDGDGYKGSARLNWGPGRGELQRFADGV